MTAPQIALATDMAYLRPTLVAMISALRNCSRPARVHILGDALTPSAVGLLEAACRMQAGTAFVHHDISGSLPDAEKVADRWPGTCLATLILPRFVEGRVLYIDSDTLTRGDVCELFDLDMQCNLVAAVREYIVLNDLRKGTFSSSNQHEITLRMMDPYPASDNFNAGVMLMDCDAIRVGAEFSDGMIGSEFLAEYGANDQYILNAAFKGRVTFVDYTWNCNWARARHVRKVVSQALPDVDLPEDGRPKIVHYMGEMKPWNMLESRYARRLSVWQKYGVEAITYLLASRRLLRSLEAQTPEGTEVVEVSRKSRPATERATLTDSFRPASALVSQAIGGAPNATARPNGRGEPHPRLHGVSAMTDVKLALASDTSYLPHTMVAMLSVLENATLPVAVHILGDEFSADAKKVVEEGCRRNGAADLVFHDLEDLLPSKQWKGTWPRTILARLHIPSLIDGRVLYLDADTCTFADISPLFKMDLGEDLIAAVRDFGVFLKFERHSEIAIRETKNAEKMMHPFPRHDYFSSGVVLFDCDRIRLDDGILSSLMDVENLKDSVFPDQDHMNLIFKNRVSFLHPSWNAFYGLTRHAVRVAKRVLPSDAVHDLQKPKIIHYVDGPKPWKPFDVRWLPKTHMMVKRFPRYLEYRLKEKRLLAPYRAAIDEAAGSAAIGLAPPHGGERAGSADVRIQIALCTDMAYLRHAWVAMASVIERASAPVTVHLVGDGLTGDAVERVASACRELADARLHHHDATDLLEDTQSMGYFARAMMGRMFLPQLADGRVLYLDPDTIAYADVRPLVEMDMGTAKIAAVRDYTVLGAFRKNRSRSVSEFRDQIALMRPLPIFEYFNSGVVLMDCSAIRQDADIMARMVDISAAAGFSFPDQDLLNSIFKNQVHFLDHSWNCLWGQDRRMARIARATLPAGPEHKATPAKIVHFVGPRKPWQELGSKGWCRVSELKTLVATLRYRMAARRLSKFLEEGDVADTRPKAPLRPQAVANRPSATGRVPAPGRAGNLGGGWLDVAISTDSAFLKPAMVAMTSMLRRCTSPVRVHFLGDGLSVLDREAAEAACRHYADAEIVHHDMTEMLKDAPSIGHLPKAAMGRVLLPNVMGGGGRILHLDADTLTLGDVAPLFGIDMKGHPVAAVRDFAILDTFRKRRERGERKYREQIELMEPFSIADYVNSGVMLLDCDAMSPELSDAMTDSLSLKATRFLDQDFLNQIFKGRVTFLDPQWNVPWGRVDRGRKFMEASFPDVPFDKAAPPQIVHFPGRRKPWHRMDPFRMMRFGRVTLQYRRLADELVGRFW